MTVILNFDTNINSIPDNLERFIIKNFNKSSPEIYSKIHKDELSNLIKLISENEEYNKYNITEEIIKSIRGSFVRNYMINMHNNIKKYSLKIFEKYNKENNVLQLSKKYKVSPLNIIRFIFAKKYSKKLTKIILNKNLISTFDTKQLNLAIENDEYALINQNSILQESENFEKKIEKLLLKINVKYKTQNDLVLEQTEKYGKAINTPDFLIISDFYINNTKINWIDAKNYYGSNTNFLKSSLKKQISKYISEYGTGCVIYKLGFNNSLHFENIILLDYKNFKNNIN